MTTNGRGSRRAGRLANLTSRPPPDLSRFVACSGDPPSGSVDTWKPMILQFELQPGSVSNITTSYIGTQLSTLGITAACIRVLKVSAWASPGITSTTTVPRIKLTCNDLTNGAPLGTRVDAGLLSKNAKLSFAWANSQRDHSLLLSTPRVVAEVEIFGSLAGTMNLSLSYLN